MFGLKFEFETAQQRHFVVGMLKNIYILKFFKGNF